MNRAHAALPLLVLALAGCGRAPSGTFESRHHAFEVVPVVEGLATPWSFAFLPDGGVLITERSGRLRIARDGALDPRPIEGVPAVRDAGQGGLLDVVLHPEFARTRLLYLSYSKPHPERGATTAVVRARLEESRLVDVEEVLEARAWSSGNQHFGSRIAFDAQGFLFVTVGDRGVRADPEDLAGHPAQNLGNHQGTILRLHDDGRVPADNPFVGVAGAMPEIWSYGHRNPQGLAFDEAGVLWASEHGPRGGDELNLVVRGANYGWPLVGHGIEYVGTRIHPATSGEGLEQPVHYWVPSIATSGLMIYRGDRFPAWRGDFFIGGLAGQQVARLKLEGRRVVESEVLLEGVARVRDLREGPDGSIYALLDRRIGSGSLVRLEPR